MASKIKVDQIQTLNGSGTIALQNQLSGMTSASMPTGSVLQVVQGSTTSQVDTSSTSYVDTTLTATITPSSTSSKILVIFHQHFYQPNAAQITMQLVRGSTSLGVMGYALHSGSSIMGFASRTHLDSPSSTSATVYKVQMKTNSIAIRANYDDGGGNSVSSITLMEIAG